MVVLRSRLSTGLASRRATSSILQSGVTRALLVRAPTQLSPPALGEVGSGRGVGRGGRPNLIVALCLTLALLLTGGWGQVPRERKQGAVLIVSRDVAPAKAILPDDTLPASNSRRPAQINAPQQHSPHAIGRHQPTLESWKDRAVTGGAALLTARSRAPSTRSLTARAPGKRTNAQSVRISARTVIPAILRLMSSFQCRDAHPQAAANT